MVSLMKSALILFFACTVFSQIVYGQEAGTNVVGNSSRGVRTLPSTTIEMNNVRASSMIQSYEAFSSQNPSSPVVEAARATVQLIPKCSIGRNGNNYYIGQGRPNPFCNGINTNHPLAAGGAPTPRNQSTGESYPTYSGQSGQCNAAACSGFLVGDQQTIGTAGHCLQKKSPEDFCKDFVIVFNRTGSRTDFSNNDIYECEGGRSVDTIQGPDMNLTSDGEGFKDHAFLRLKRPVQTSVARALEVSDTTTRTPGETLYAVGHPDGNPRMVSPIRYTVSPNRNGYSYIQGNGYLYQGNSGGPLLDSRGRVAGIATSTDDTAYGVPSRRQPLVISEESGQRCRTQIATGTNVVEFVGFGREVRGDLESQLSSGVQSTVESTTVAP